MSSLAYPPAEDVETELRDLRARVSRLTGELAEARAHAAKLEAQAHEDPLTGLLNRRGFLRDLARAIAFGGRYAAPAALLLVDLDRFKPVNDAYGHPTGDHALKHVGVVLRRMVRGSDSVGRLGGDEFGLVIWQAEGLDADRKARCIEDAIAASPLSVGGLALHLKASVGGTLLQQDDTTDAAIARADRAMYARKQERGGPMR